MSTKTRNATDDPDREPTDFEQYVRRLEKDPEERQALEEARKELRARLDAEGSADA